MGHALIAQKFDSFIHRPSEKKFRSLQRLVMAESDYDPRARRILQLESRAQTTGPGELLREIEQLSWFWQLCPRLHFLEARTWERRGRSQQRSESVGRMQACLRGILATGDGSREAPFAVTFLTDQRDVLQVIGEDLRHRQLVQVEDRYCDVITSHAGSDVWFDVTPLLERTAQPLTASSARGL